MSIKKNLVAGVLLVALTGTLASCGGGDKAVDAVKGAGEAGAGAVKGAGEAGAGAAGAAGTAIKGAGDAVKNSAAIAPLVAQAKGPLGAVGIDIKAGKMDKAKAGFAKFESVWKTVGPKLQPLAGDKYDAINSGVEKLSAAMGGGDKTKAGEALTGVMKAFDAATAKK
jgi:hypothetical protein